jgi:hypothetical protein
MPSPHHTDGPFVNDTRGPGLLRRLLGGGTNDPTSPHTHRESTTREVHRQPLRRAANPTPVAPMGSPVGFPRSLPRSEPDTQLPSGSGRPPVVRFVVWMFRHPRIAVALVAGLLVLVGQASDAPSELEQRSQDLQAVQDAFDDGASQSPDVAMPGLATAPTTANELRGTISQVTGDGVTFGFGPGNSEGFTWKVATPQVRAALVRNLNQEVTVTWELRAADIYVIGVDGPNAVAAAPGAP